MPPAAAFIGAAAAAGMLRVVGDTFIKHRDVTHAIIQRAREKTR